MSKSQAQWQAGPAEDRYRRVIDSLKEVVFQADAQGAWTFLNPAWTELTGFRVEETLGRPFLDFIHPEDRALSSELFLAMLGRQRTECRHELRCLRRGGGYVWTEVFARPVLAEDGAVAGSSGTLSDISERRRADDALERRERYLLALVEMQQRLLAAQEEDNPYQGVLEPLGRASGASRVYVFDIHPGPLHELLMSQRAEWCAPGVKPEIDNPTLQNLPLEPHFSRWSQVLPRGETVAGLVADFPPNERAILEPQGILSILVLPLRVNGTWVGFIGFDQCSEARAWDKLEVDLLSAAAGALSLTLEQRRSEQVLREREQRFRRLAENASDVLYRYRLQPPLGFEYVSPSVAAKLGPGPQEHYADPELWHRLVHPADQPALARVLTEPSAPVVLRFTSPTGRTVWLEHVATLLLDASGQPLAVEGLARDITERRQAEEALKLSEASFRLLVEGVPDAVAIQRDGRIVYANAALVDALGLPDASALEGRVLADFVLELEGGAEAPKPGAHKELLTGERRLKRPDGKARVAEFASLPLLFDGQPAVVSIARDVTEQRHLQARLLLADRLTSMGTLSAGIAHEINNPLSFVLSNLGFLSDAVGRALSGETRADLEEWREVLSEACEGAERVRQIVRQLKTFSRPDEESLHAVDVHAVLDSVVMMAGNEIRHRARLRREWGVVPPVLGNEGRLSQVFLNLVVNAAQAIPEGSAHAHEIRLSTRRDAQGRVVVEVHDTGVGIPREVIGRIFDPFFTTKPVGVGTGLGLSVCHGIITNLNGDITVESEPGQGTTFRVTLPAAAMAGPRPAGPLPVAPSPRRGRVLVVDDEPGVGRVLQRLLREHEVEVAGGGRQALERLTRSPADFDVILCDVMMPDLTGRELYEAVRGRLPGLERRFVFVSGGAFTAGAREFLANIPNPTLEKPFDEARLRTVVRELVVSGPSSH